MKKQNLTTLEDYFSSLEPEKLDFLSNFLEKMEAFLPESAKLELNYGIPIFRYKGKMLVGAAAYQKHYSFFPCDSTTTTVFADELKNFKTAKGTIQFTPNQLLDDELLKKIIDRRVELAESKK